MIIINKTHILFVSVFIVLLCGFGYSQSNLGIMPFSNFTSDTSVSDLYVQLFKRLQFELLPSGIKPYLVENGDCEDCSVVVSGSIEGVGSVQSLHLLVYDKKRDNKELKVIPLSVYSVDDIIDLCILKIRHFLERNHSTKVRVSSMPLDCEIYVDGIKVGMTPAELVLEHGVYRLALEHEYCGSFRDSIVVSSGPDIDIDATLDFIGYRSKPFLYSSLFFTIATTTAWILESKYHSEYLKIGKEGSSDEFTDRFKHYQAANYARIGLLNGAILSWTVTGFFSYKNITLKKRLFTKP